MSRIGKQPVIIPEGIIVKINKSTVNITGPLGTLEKTFHHSVKMELEKNLVRVQPCDQSRVARANWGTCVAVIRNMVLGVKEGFSKTLIIKGVGYRAKLADNKITLTLGYSHPVILDVPQGLKIEIEKATKIVIKGYDKVLVGQFAANIRKVRQPNPYSGKGVMYHDEIVRRKEGKTAKTGA